MSETRRWWFTALVAGLSMTAPAAHAQRGAVVGVVEDSSGAPLFAVTVTVPGAQFSVATDNAGRFRFPSLPAGTWKLDVRRLGYSPVVTEIEVRSGDTLSLSVVLLPSAVPIAPIFVSETDITPKLRAVGFERRRLATTVPARQFVTRQQIEKQNPMRLSQVLGRMFGPRACQNPVMFLDGALRAPSPKDPPVSPANARRGESMPRPVPVDDIPPSEIEGLEVYVGGAQIPVEFKSAGRGGGCVLVIWTR